MYDYYLGGSHNFAVDRELAERAIQVRPELPLLALANRAFLHRAVRLLVGAGIRQFLDVGSGIPTVGNVHEVARAAAADTRVVYVDVDPVAVAHSRAMLGGDDRVGVVQADVRDPERVLGSPEARRLLDLTEPVGLLLVAVMHFVPETEESQRALTVLRDAAPTGSLLAVTYALPTYQPDVDAKMKELYDRSTTPGAGRDLDGVRRLFGGWQLIDPGLVPVSRWRPDPADVEPDALARANFYAGVAVKP